MKMSTFAEQFNSEFRNLMQDPQSVVLQLSKLQAWVLFCHLQLALRHPENSGPCAELAREIALMLEKALATSPALQQIAAMGWVEGLPDAIAVSLQ